MISQVVTGLQKMDEHLRADLEIAAVVSHMSVICSCTINGHYGVEQA